MIELFCGVLIGMSLLTLIVMFGYVCYGFISIILDI